MNLKGIVSVSGKGGLFKVIGQNKGGFILESMDENRIKLATGATSKLATLEDITVFGEDEDISLKAIFQSMKEKEAELPVPDNKAEGKVLKSYFEKVAPDYNRERVYTSDIKKIISWYRIISVLPPFEEKEEQAPKE